MSDFTRKNLEELDDQAARHGFGPAFSARFGFADLGARETALSLQRLAPGESQPFAHRHKDAEEIYVVLDGGGEILVDDEVVPVRRLDAVRVGPSTVRAFRAGGEGLEYLVFGARHEGDAETVQVEWPA